MKKRIVVTGIGVLQSIGKTKEEFWTALEQGKTGYDEITLFDTTPFRVTKACEVKDFDPKEYLGKKGLRTLDRSTKLLVSAAKLAIDDSGFEITEANTDEVGVVVGTTFGSIQSIADFDKVTLEEGPRNTNPSLFPNTVINSPASQVSIWHKLAGFNATVSTGFTASMDALSYAYDFLQLGRASAILVGAVEEMCEKTFFGLESLNFLSGSDGDFLDCPFDKRRNGIVFGEGAYFFVLEEYENAKQRGANILGEILGVGECFIPNTLNKYPRTGEGLKKAIEKVLIYTGVEPSSIDYVASYANSTIEGDRLEAIVIQDLFNSTTPVNAIKSMTGDCMSVSGGFSLIGALGSINRGFISPICNYEVEDKDCRLNVVKSTLKKS